MIERYLLYWVLRWLAYMHPLAFEDMLKNTWSWDNLGIKWPDPKAKSTPYECLKERVRAYGLERKLEYDDSSNK